MGNVLYFVLNKDNLAVNSIAIFTKIVRAYMRQATNGRTMSHNQPIQFLNNLFCAHLRTPNKLFFFVKLGLSA